MRRIIIGTLLSFAAVALVAAPAYSAKNNPHHEEQDGCDHGHTGKPCRPDPQPDHGKDCDKHGNHGGVNEDHCQGTTTTTQPPTTTTTVPPTTTTTVPPTTTTTTSPVVPVTPENPVSVPEVPTPTVPVSPSTPGTNCVTPAGEPYVTSYPECPKPITPTVTVPPVTELPHTGSTVIPLVFIGALLTVLGFALRRAVRLNRG